MMKVFYLALVSTLFLSFQQNDKILWSEKTKLTWDNFQGKPNVSSSYKANTETEVSVQIKTKGDEAVITLECFFVKNLAWTKTKDNADLLVHEQMHFNITELSARKFRKRLKGKSFEAKYFQRELNELRSEIGRESKAIQLEYDKETEHSVNEAAQTKWNKKVLSELKPLNAYADTQVSCKIKG